MSEKLSDKLKVSVTAPFHSAEITMETGWIAKQAEGAVMVRQGDTMVLVTVCTKPPANPDQDFLPLVVEYQEKTYAAGRIPGGYIKREGRPAEIEILTSRLIDRPVRPLWPEGFFDEVQIICTVLSADGVHSPDVLAISGASAALHISKLPFLGPIAGVRVGRVNGKLIANPTKEEIKQSDLEFIIVGSKDAVVMVEGGASIVPEQEILDALYFGHDECQKLIALQDELRKKVGKPKAEVVAPKHDEAIVARVKTLAETELYRINGIFNKAERREAMTGLSTLVTTTLATEFPERTKEVKKVYEDLLYFVSRNKIVRDKIRIDGRKPNQVRAIECQTGILPRAHGSALFTRGETQAIVTTTLGTGDDAQTIENLGSRTEKMFMLH